MSPEKRSDLLAEMGTAALMRGDPSVAIEDLHKAVVANPKNSGAHNNLGLAYLQLGQKDFARNEFQASIDADDNADAHVNLGTMAEGAHHYDEARRHYRVAIDNLKYKTRHRALTNLAELELHLNRTDEARTLLYQSIQANPEYCLSHFLLGSIYVRDNNPTAATAEFKKSVKSSCVRNVEAHYQLALAYVRLKNYEKARKEFAFLIEQFPETLQAQHAGDQLKALP